MLWRSYTSDETGSVCKFVGVGKDSKPEQRLGTLAAIGGNFIVCYMQLLV